MLTITYELKIKGEVSSFCIISIFVAHAYTFTLLIYFSQILLCPEDLMMLLIPFPLNFVDAAISCYFAADGKEEKKEVKKEPVEVKEETKSTDKR